MNIKRVSTSALAKTMGMKPGDVFAILKTRGLVEKTGDDWHLTELGRQKGGDYIESKQYGRYIGWPEALASDPIFAAEGADPEDLAHDSRIISATTIGKRFDLSPQRINSVLSELGWISKGIKGWNISEQGRRVGGKQMEHPKTGVPYVVWPEDLLQNSTLVSSIEEVVGIAPAGGHTQATKSEAVAFREKFEAKHRAADGHFVRSKAEMLIDNWLYMAEIVHAYERKLPVEEDVYCDFYIPSGKVYIEYWGIEDDAKYQARKEQKQAVYQKYAFKLIELNEADVQNLDDVLPRKLLRFDVQSY
ncbi:MAG: glycerol kinase [Planctomycetaceae bacterium]|nr:hypothetical protein [Planctomycetaceae bacterium]